MKNDQLVSKPFPLDTPLCFACKTIRTTLEIIYILTQNSIHFYIVTQICAGELGHRLFGATLLSKPMMNQQCEIVNRLVYIAHDNT